MGGEGEWVRRRRLPTWSGVGCGVIRIGWMYTCDIDLEMNKYVRCEVDVFEIGW